MGHFHGRKRESRILDGVVKYGFGDVEGAGREPLQGWNDDRLVLTGPGGILELPGDF